MKPDQQLVLLQSAVALRVQGREVRESVRLGLASIEQALLSQVGPLVRKRVAARLLGCSVQSLDRWIAKGVIAVEPIAEGSSRMAIPSTELVDLAYEQATSNTDGLAASIHSLEARRQRTQEFREIHELITVGGRWARLVRARGTA